MKCEGYEEFLSAYLDDTLTSEEKRVLEEHLSSCLSCQEMLEQLKYITAELNKLKDVALPEGFHEDLKMRLRRENKKKTKWIPYISGLAAACVIGIVAMYEVPFGQSNEVGSARKSTSDVMPIDETIQPFSVEQQPAAPMQVDRAVSRSVADKEEQVWQIKSSSKDLLKEKIEAYCKEKQLQYQIWEENDLVHISLTSVSDDKGVLYFIEETGLVKEDVKIEGQNTERIHLVIEAK